jgi:hypothetical protein
VLARLIRSHQIVPQPATTVPHNMTSPLADSGGPRPTGATCGQPLATQMHARLLVTVRMMRTMRGLDMAAIATESTCMAMTGGRTIATLTRATVTAIATAMLEAAAAVVVGVMQGAWGVVNATTTSVTETAATGGIGGRGSSRARRQTCLAAQPRTSLPSQQRRQRQTQRTMTLMMTCARSRLCPKESLLGAGDRIVSLAFS